MIKIKPIKRSKISTVQGYINAMRRLDSVSIGSLKDFDTLPIEWKKELKLFDGELSNSLGELEINTYSKETDLKPLFD